MSWIYKGKIAYHCEDCIYAPQEIPCPEDADGERIPKAGVQTVCPAFRPHPVAEMVAARKLEAHHVYDDYAERYATVVKAVEETEKRDG